MAAQGPELVEACRARSDLIGSALAELDDSTLATPSALPGWNRLTIACHLRYGASALRRMTDDALAGRPTASYPAGRLAQRPATLEPGPGERPADVVGSLLFESQALDRLWSELDVGAWSIAVQEPADHPDLGSLPLSALALLRLTELEVHGSDLALCGAGLEDWSPLFVQAALPFRLEWLPKRRSNRRPFEEVGEGSWLLSASDGPTYLIRLERGGVQSESANPLTPARSVIRGPARDLLAFLLGRPCRADLDYAGDAAFARAFQRAFPGP